MPPTIALLLCTAFVLFLLCVEWRASRDNSLAVWIPTVWMLIIASRPLATWFVVTNSPSQGNDSGSALDRWVLTTLAAAAILVLLNRGISRWGSMRGQGWLLVILGYMLLSTFWSEITLIALKRWTREVIVLVMALVIVSEVKPGQALASVLRRTAYVLIPFSIVLIKYYPLLGRAYGRFSGIGMWTGVTGQKNHLGRLCMISVLFLLWALSQRWRDRPLETESNGRYGGWADVFVMILALYVLIGSNSATSLVTLAVGVTIFLVLRRLRKTQVRVPLVGLLALVFGLICFSAYTPFRGGSDVAAFTSTLGRDNTLTGRTEIWSDVIPDLREQPLMGYGFGSFWTDARRARYEIPTAHNGYLDILLEQGVVGLVLYTFWLLSCTRHLHRALRYDSEWASLAITFLIVGLIYNITESALNTFTELMTAVMVLTYSVALCQMRSGMEPAQHAATGFEIGAKWRARAVRPEFNKNSWR